MVWIPATEKNFVFDLLYSQEQLKFYVYKYIFQSEIVEIQIFITEITNFIYFSY